MAQLAKLELSLAKLSPSLFFYLLKMVVVQNKAAKEFETSWKARFWYTVKLLKLLLENKIMWFLSCSDLWFHQNLFGYLAKLQLETLPLSDNFDLSFKSLVISQLPE